MAKKKPTGPLNTDIYYPTDYSIGKKPSKEEPVPINKSCPPVPRKKWYGIIIASLIPLFNLIPLTVWSKKTNALVPYDQKNFARAMRNISLIFYLIAITGATVALILIENGVL